MLTHVVCGMVYATWSCAKYRRTVDSRVRGRQPDADRGHSIGESATRGQGRLCDLHTLGPRRPGLFAELEEADLLVLACRNDCR